MYMYITINKKKSTCMTVKGQLRIYFGRWGSILRWRGTQIWSKPRAEGTHICSKPEEVTFLLKFSKNSMYLIYLCTNKLKTRLINTTNTPPVRENQKTLYIMHIMHYKYIKIFKFYGGGAPRLEVQISVIVRWGGAWGTQIWLTKNLKIPPPSNNF